MSLELEPITEWAFGQLEAITEWAFGQLGWKHIPFTVGLVNRYFCELFRDERAKLEKYYSRDLTWRVQYVHNNIWRHYSPYVRKTIITNEDNGLIEGWDIENGSAEVNLHEPCGSYYIISGLTCPKGWSIEIGFDPTQRNRGGVIRPSHVVNDMRFTATLEDIDFHADRPWPLYIPGLHGDHWDRDSDPHMAINWVGEGDPPDVIPDITFTVYIPRSAREWEWKYEDCYWVNHDLKEEFNYW